MKEKLSSKKNEFNVINKQIDELYLQIYNENSDDFIREIFQEINENSKVSDFVDIEELDDQELPIYVEKLENTKKYLNGNINDLFMGFLEFMKECENQKSTQSLQR